MLLTACGGKGAPAAVDAGLLVGDDLVDTPLARATPAEVQAFHEGDARFDTVFAPADGLGPVYVRNSCASCHATAEKGPGLVQKFALVEADGFTPVPDAGFPYGHTIRPYVVGDALPVLAPDAGEPDDGGARWLITTRIGPALFGRGYIEAVADSEIERVASEQAARSDGIHGVVNQVVYHSQPNSDATFGAHQPGDVLIGRFGLKARNASLDDFAADAFQGDMGMTTPMRPTELPNPAGLTDDQKIGTDLDIDMVNSVATYLRLIEIPRRPAPDAMGQGAFSSARCDVCHVPTLHSRADYPIAELANLDAPIYSDLLLHDLGDALADGIVDEQASSRQWKTAPLIGLRFEKAYLHDGRAHSIDEAIRDHASAGSEANDSVARYQALSDSDRQALLDFVGSL